jgi:hypothetical protein
MFKTSNLSELSFEEQLALAEARSKFDAVCLSDVSSADEQDLMEIALLKSKDPSEQIDLDNRVRIRVAR